MTLPRFVIRVVSVVAVLCPIILLVSCRSMMSFPPQSVGSSVGSIRSAILDPFQAVDHQQLSRANSAMTLVNARVKPATAALGKRFLTLEDCRSIALTNNLDLQVARVEELTKRAIEYSNKTKLLPHFLFSGDLSERDNYGYSYSDVLGQEGLNPQPGSSGTGVTNYSTGHERSTWRYLLETRWSPTDAALAYYLSSSSANDRLRAHYQKLRVAQKLIALVDSAYFRLLSLQECLPLAEQQAAARSGVADSMKRIYKKGIVGVSEYNRAKRQAIRTNRLLSRIRTEIEKQRNILASAMALSPDYGADGGFRLVGLLSPPAFSGELSDLEMTAVQNRPEAFETGLSYINSNNDLKRTIVKYFPKVSGFWRFTRDKDKFLYNKDWKEVGLSVYFDLLDFLSNNEESRAAGFNTEKTQREMGVVALGITSQVRVAALQYFDAMDELKSTAEALGGTQEVMQVASERAARDDLDRIALEEAKADMLQDRLERTRALGEANAGLAELQGAMGINYNEILPKD